MWTVVREDVVCLLWWSLSTMMSTRPLMPVLNVRKFHTLGGGIGGIGPHLCIPGQVAQLVTCLATDASLTADPGVTSSIPARSNTFVEIDHEIISTVILLPSAESFKKGCCQLHWKYVHKVLVNCLFKHAQEKVWLHVGELTVPPWP